MSAFSPLVDDASNNPDARLRALARKKLLELIDHPNNQIALGACKAVASFSPERPVPEVDFAGWRPEYAGIPSSVLLAKLQAAGYEGGGGSILPRRR